MGRASHHGNDCWQCDGEGSYGVITQAPHPHYQNVMLDPPTIRLEGGDYFRAPREKVYRFKHYVRCEICGGGGVGTSFKQDKWSYRQTPAIKIY